MNKEWKSIFDKIGRYIYLISQKSKVFWLYYVKMYVSWEFKISIRNLIY